jgi:hypothetical protein
MGCNANFDPEKIKNANVLNAREIIEINNKRKKNTLSF